ncbi:MAG: hypothetical protein IT204_24465 [Fimbriimonadaceae bacterium]|nr:hypothetical protein [Fimbriimonadaceae bacterium]
MSSLLLPAVVSPDNLWQAWQAVRERDSAPGLDGQAVAHVASDPEPWLRKLRGEVLAGRYRPWPRRRVWVPKASGGRRPLGIATLRDRLLQRAVLQLLQPLAEPLFNGSSFAYRPGRSLRQAVRAVRQGQRHGFHLILEADVDDCFDSLDHDLLRSAVRRLVPADDLRALIGLWLRAGVVERGRLVVPERGVSQGDILSPLLCNLYLDPLDDACEAAGHRLVRYADDFIVLCRNGAALRQATACVEQTLTALRLRLEPTKTGPSSFEHGFTFLGVQFQGNRAAAVSPRLGFDAAGELRARPQPRYEDRPPGPAQDHASRVERTLNRHAAIASRGHRPPNQVAHALQEALEHRGTWDDLEWI